MLNDTQKRVSAALLALCCALPLVSAEDADGPPAPPPNSPPPQVKVESSDRDNASSGRIPRRRPRGDERRQGSGDPPPAPKPDGDADGSVGESVPINDPTNPSPAVRNALDPHPVVQLPNVAPVIVQAAPPPPVLPDITLRAFIETEGRPPAALIEVDGKVQRRVAEGSELSARPAHGQLLTLRVKKLSRDGVEVEVVQLKQSIFLR